MVHYTATGRSAGEEGAITDQGRYITVLESDLVHPYHADGFADKGDPVLIGDNIVGVVCSDSPTAATDLVTVDTEGLWYLYVIGSVSDGTSDGVAKALTAGTPIYFQVTPGSDTYLLSGEQDPAHFRPFGYLLTAVSAHVSTPTLALVKVHNAPAPLGGILHFGSGSTAAGNFLLEGDTAIRQSKLIEACIAPATLLLAGEQLHGFNIRVVDNLIATGGEITAGELQHDRAQARLRQQERRNRPVRPWPGHHDGGCTRHNPGNPQRHPRQQLRYSGHPGRAARTRSSNDLRGRGCRQDRRRKDCGDLRHHRRIAVLDPVLRRLMRSA